MRVRGVSVATTSATLGDEPPRSVAPVPLLPPRIAVVVVAVALPEARLVVDRAAPARAPTSRSSRSRGAGRAAAPGRRAPGRAARRRTRTRSTPCRRSRPRAAGSSCSRRRRTRRRARPRSRRRRGACRPRRPPTSVSSFDHFVTQWMSFGDRLARQRAELVPRPAARLVDLAVDRERPLVERRVRRRPRREHREVVGQVLARRDAVARRRRRATCPESHGRSGSSPGSSQTAASPAAVSGSPSRRRPDRAGRPRARANAKPPAVRVERVQEAAVGGSAPRRARPSRRGVVEPATASTSSSEPSSPIA